MRASRNDFDASPTLVWLDGDIRHDIIEADDHEGWAIINSGILASLEKPDEFRGYFERNGFWCFKWSAKVSFIEKRHLSHGSQADTQYAAQLWHRFREMQEAFLSPNKTRADQYYLCGLFAPMDRLNQIEQLTAERIDATYAKWKEGIATSHNREGAKIAV